MGKRSGVGFVSHKSRLVNALSRATADRIILLDNFTLGRKGLLGYVKALTGSNIVKIVPASSNGGASEEQTAVKRLKIVCGAMTGFLSDMSWIGEKTPVSHAKVRVSPQNNVKCNLGSAELAEAIDRVLPFTTKDDNRPTLRCVLFRVSEGKLVLCSSDGFRLAEITLDFPARRDIEVLINRDDLKGLPNAIRKARRVRLDVGKGGESLDGRVLLIDTELIRYEFRGVDGKFPDYSQTIPTDFTATAHLDTIEGIKALGSFKALSENPKSFPIDLAIGNGGILLTSPDDNGSATLCADVEGEVSLRVDGKYLVDVLKACGGMVDLSVKNGHSAMLFTTDGCQFVIMPLMTSGDVSTEPTGEEQTDTEPELEPELVEAES